MKKEIIYFMAGMLLSTCIFTIAYVELKLKKEEEINDAYLEGFEAYKKDICNRFHDRY